MQIDLYDCTRRELAEVVVGLGGRPVHARRLWSYLYREAVQDFAALHDLPGRLRTALMRAARLTALATAGEIRSDDGLTQKFLLELADGRQIETVLMRFAGRVTACLSSQVGCAWGCVFCATGQAGFTRNLSAGEIVAQAMHVARQLRGSPHQEDTNKADGSPCDRSESLRNLVVMGMGEPLHNYDAVMQSLDILRDPGGLAIGVKQITISTAGLAPGIVRLADEARPFSLAVSLHSADQFDRAALIPAAKSWPLDVLMEACRYYTSKLDRKIFFEWTLIEGQNDSADQARALARLVDGMPAQINLIPLNPTQGFSGQPALMESARSFAAILRDHHVPVSIRQRRGIDISAGCGQLAGVTSSFVSFERGAL